MILAAAAAATLVGASVQSATGFGFALILSPALLALLAPSEAVTALLLLGFALNLLLLVGEGRQSAAIRWRAVGPMLLAALPGLAVGAVLLTQLSREALQVAVGVAVIAAAGWQLRRRARREPPRLAGGAGVAAGFASGVLTTSISVSGPPVVLWLEARGATPEEFRASLAATFLALNLAGALLLGAEGSASIEAGTVAPLLGLVVAGYAMGAVAFRRLDRERFFTVVLALVAGTGAASVAAGAGLL